MGTEWSALCKAPRIELDGDEATVGFENGRFHRVTVRETDDAFEFHAVVARASAVKEIADLALRIWRQNRAAHLVGFRIDSRGRVCAEGWVPKAGLTALEFQLVLRHVAAESDRLEFLLTGRDDE